MRQFLIIAIPLLLPTLFYLIRMAILLWFYKRAQRQYREEPEKSKQIIDVTPPRSKKIPWIDLIIIGILLSIMTLVGFALMGGDAPGGKRVPVHVEDGKIVPSYIDREN